MFITGFHAVTGRFWADLNGLLTVVRTFDALEKFIDAGADFFDTLDKLIDAGAIFFDALNKLIDADAIFFDALEKLIND